MSIYVQIVSASGPISAAIRFSTRSWASHAEFIDTDRNVTLGARFNGGVRERPCKIDHYTRIERFTAANISMTYQIAETQIGKPYDLSAVTGVALDRDWHDTSRFFCSELIAWAFEQAQSPLLSMRPSSSIYRITPRDLLLSRALVFVSKSET